jgi:hypothetical protein
VPTVNFANLFDRAAERNLEDLNILWAIYAMRTQKKKLHHRYSELLLIRRTV